MTNDNLAKSYFIKAEKRLKILDILLNEEDYSDVVREAQEIVELSLKGMLRFVGVEPPKYHDVGPLIVEHKERFKGISSEEIMKIAQISRKLRKERELAFYGDIDFIPTEEYTLDDANEAIEGARFVVKIAQRSIHK
jgi:HEPN domain-containing protein